jgi:tetratricopeptide (TPR) repeat protein
MLLPKWLWMVTISLLLVFLSSLASAQTPGPALSKNAADANPADPDRQEALRLYKEHKIDETAEWWQKVVARYPGDMAAHEALGSSLLSRAALQPDREKKISDRVQAHAELVRAQELGDNSDLCKALLSAVPEDGSEVRFPNQKEVRAAVVRGDAALQGLDWDGAAREYSLAVELDPGNFFTPTEIGLKHARLKQWAVAGDWYALSLRIKPGYGAAYGNWAEALIEAGEMKEAREKLIQGLLIGNTDVIMRTWLLRNHLKLNKLDVTLPHEYPISKTGTMIVVDPAWLGKNDGRDAWLMYPRARRLWKSKMELTYSRYQHTLEEEVDALSQVVMAFNESLAKGNVKEPDPSLVMLSRFQAEGFLEAFVLLVLHEDDLLNGYRYGTTHHDKLIEFADKYMVPPAP